MNLFWFSGFPIAVGWVSSEGELDSSRQDIGSMASHWQYGSWWWDSFLTGAPFGRYDEFVAVRTDFVRNGFGWCSGRHLGWVQCW